MVLLFALLAAGAVFSQQIVLYHEVWCPSVDTTRMTRMKRGTAEAQGMVPAPDCHAMGVRYLGVSGAAPREETRMTRVSGYTRAGGTRVEGYMRREPQHELEAQSERGRVHVTGHMRDGTHVREHWRDAPKKR
ncbi:MAG TPA: hypothetical protein VF883_06430 [Thermoanaerobaculia bacterium]